jgi:hypothetical protein
MFNLYGFSPVTYVQCQHFLYSGKYCISDLQHLLSKTNIMRYQNYNFIYNNLILKSM